MRQVKIFKNLESNVADLEKEVNAWIRQSGAQVVSVTGNISAQSEATKSGGSLGSSFAPSDVILIILYETSA